MNRGDKGAFVVQVQRQLVELGYPLPRWGIDGDCGDETIAAFDVFLRDHGQDVSDERRDELSSPEIQRLMEVGQRIRNMRPGPTLTEPLVLDRTAQAAVAGRHLDYGARPWTEVTAIMLHQTACWLSNSSDDARCDAVGAHRVIYPDGRRFKLHPLNRRIVHGHGGNTRCIGYEIDGNFPGVKGDDSTRWKPGGRAALLTDAQAEAVLRQAREDIAEVKAHGGHVAFVLAHRQASRDRQGDPGSEIWQRIAVPLIAELGLSDGGPGWVFPDANGGMPLPDSWTGVARGVGY